MNVNLDRGIHLTIPLVDPVPTSGMAVAGSNLRFLKSQCQH